MLLLPVLPSPPGSTPSRPSANAYRQTALWNASAAANKLVRNSHWAACDSTLPPRPTSARSPALAAATTCALPACAAIAHADPAYTTPIRPSAV